MYLAASHTSLKSILLRQDIVIETRLRDLNQDSLHHLWYFIALNF